MEKNELFSKLYTQAHSTINGRGVWHYLIDTSIGQFHIVEYEGEAMELQRQIIDENNKKAEKAYNTAIKKILEGW